MVIFIPSKQRLMRYIYSGVIEHGSEGSTAGYPAENFYAFLSRRQQKFPPPSLDWLGGESRKWPCRSKVLSSEQVQVLSGDTEKLESIVDIVYASEAIYSTTKS